MRAAAMLQSESRMSVAGSLRLYGLSFNAHYYRRRPKKARRFDPGVLAGIEEISGRRPTYGSRRLAAQAARELGRPVNRKQAQGTARAMGIISPQDGKKDAIRKARKPRFKPTGPNRFRETDITYVWCGPAGGWGYCFNAADVFARHCAKASGPDRVMRQRRSSVQDHAGRRAAVWCRSPQKARRLTAIADRAPM